MKRLPYKNLTYISQPSIKHPTPSTMAHTMSFPDEIVFRIISFMDIDTRRSLGIYTKLKVPKSLQDLISATFQPGCVTSDLSDFSHINDDRVGNCYYKYIEFPGVCPCKKREMKCSYTICHEIYSDRVMYHIIHSKRIPSRKTVQQLLQEYDLYHTTGVRVPNTEDHCNNCETQWDLAYGYQSYKLKDVNRLQLFMQKYYDYVNYDEIFEMVHELYLDDMFAE